MPCDESVTVSCSGHRVARTRRLSSVRSASGALNRKGRIAVSVFAAVAPTVADGTPATPAAITASPTRRADDDESARTTNAAKTIIPVRKLTRRVSRSIDFIVSPSTHETRREACDPSDKGIDDTFVSVAARTPRAQHDVSSRSLRLPKRSEGGAHFGREQFRLLPRGKMSALGNLVEVRQARVRSTSPRLRRKIRVFPENRNGDWQFDVGS